MSLAYSGADGVNNLSKKKGEVKDCFESVNRATFAFNQGLDNLIFEPLPNCHPPKNNIHNKKCSK